MDSIAKLNPNPLLTTAELAARPDFELGEATISPSTRTVRGPAGETDLEPRVMQVLVVLADSAGTVVTRETLFDRCWGNSLVGDDSLNRAIAGVRRIAETIAAGSFTVETVPRTGYRLLVQRGALAKEADSAPRPMVTRRALVGSGVAALAAAGGFGLWYVDGQRDREFNELMAQGVKGLEYGDPSSNYGQYFQRAAALRPDNAKAQGLFALARAIRADNAETGTDMALQDAERAARAALAIDPGEPNARLAQIYMQQSMLDFAATEDRLREILARAPDNFIAMRQLWGLLQSTGRSRDALALIERGFAMKPLAAGTNYPRAQLLWILGRTAEADRVIDRALQYWPSHRFVRFARFTILAFTGRPRVALAMLDKQETSPQNFSPEAVSLWRVSLAALDQRSQATVAVARRANLEAAKQDLRLANQAASVLSALGDIDAAFEVTDALFAVRRSKDFSHGTAANRPPNRSTAWRFAPWLFTPPTAPMRADLRFKTICDEIGLTDYWSKRGIKPDYQLGFV